MTVELLQTLSLVLYVLAFVFFVLALILFFVFNVPRLYGDVSGRNAKKAIESIRRHNEASGEKGYKPSVVNFKRGKLTDKISESGRLNIHTDNLPVGVETERIQSANTRNISEETTGLSNETMVLANETTVLYDDNKNGQEEKLHYSEKVANSMNIDRSSESSFVEDKCVLEYELSFTESSEIIE